jgi:predicted site-specific integrase-resolvase
VILCLTHEEYRVRKSLLSIGEVAQELGVSVSTLRRWDKLGKLKPVLRTLGNHRRDLCSMICQFKGQKRINIGYARVSSHDQKKDLETQTQVLKSYAQEHHIPDFELISDLGSGLNFKKRGLRQLISLILSNRVDTLYITHKDRLLRFGTELMITIAHQFNTQVVILNAQTESFESQLAQDVLEIITVFSARLYGSRSHKNKKRLKRP